MPFLPKPARPYFSSGPCAKPLGWSPDQVFNSFLLGRSHRSTEALTQIQTVLSKTRTLLKIPDTHFLAIVPGSATGAMEMGMWNLLGAKGIDVWAFDVFSARWAKDIQHELRLTDVRVLEGSAKHVPEFISADLSRDQVFAWGGTTSGIWLQNLSWLSDTREGLTLCDATSVAFAADLPWDLLDFTAFSWQKGLGSEAGQGVIVLSPRAMARLKNHIPMRAIPRVFNLREDTWIQHGQFEGSLFSGATLNTISMLTLSDCLWALEWAEKKGGLEGLLQRVQNNFDILNQWVQRMPWIDFLCTTPHMRSPIAVCLEITDSLILSLSRVDKWRFLKTISDQLERENVAFDFLNHSSAEPAFRFWCGPTVEAEDLKKMLPWLEASFYEAKEHFMLPLESSNKVTENYV